MGATMGYLTICCQSFRAIYRTYKEPLLPNVCQKTNFTPILNFFKNRPFWPSNSRSFSAKYLARFSWLESLGKRPKFQWFSEYESNFLMALIVLEIFSKMCEKHVFQMSFSSLNYPRSQAVSHSSSLNQLNNYMKKLQA